MDEFIQLLDTIVSIADTPRSPNDLITFSDKHVSRGQHLVYNAVQLADELLIDSDGKCNWENIEILRNYGYGVDALERDQFGWLTGGIFTIRGVIVYS